jgi:hypothetical protein
MIRLTRQETTFGVAVLISILIGVTVRQVRHPADAAKLRSPGLSAPVIPAKK